MEYAILVKRYHNRAVSDYLKFYDLDTGASAVTNERDEAETWADEREAHQIADHIGGYVVKI